MTHRMMRVGMVGTAGLERRVRDWVIDPSTFDIGTGGDSTTELSTAFTVTAP